MTHSRVERFTAGPCGTVTLLCTEAQDQSRAVTYFNPVNYVAEEPTSEPRPAWRCRANKARGPQQVSAARVIALWPVAIIERSHTATSAVVGSNGRGGGGVAARDFCAAFARDDQLHTTLRSGDADALPCDSTAFPEVQLSA